MPRPDAYPEWASQDNTDPVSLSPNVIEPPPEKKQRGWNRLEKPPRNWENWLHRKIYEWIVYFDENLDFEADAFTPTWTNLTGITSNKGFFSRNGDLCYIGIETYYTGNAGAGNLTITNLPFASKNEVSFNQIFQVRRGVGPTIPGSPNSTVLYGIVSPNTTLLSIFAENVITGTGAIVTNAGAQGQIIISGYYLVEA